MTTSLALLIGGDAVGDTDFFISTLQGFGYQVAFTRVETMASLEAALDSRAFDLILMEHDVPQLDWKETLALLSRRCLALPVLVVAEQISTGAALRVIQEGAYDCVTRADLSQLVLAVERARRAAARQRQLREASWRRQGRQAGDTFTGTAEHAQAMEFFAAVANSSPIGMFITQDGKFQLVNQQFEKFTGYSLGELVGREAVSLVVPEDRTLVRECAIKMLKGGAASPYEYRIVTCAGKTRWIGETVASVQYKGRRACLGNFVDITEIKHIREELRRSLARFQETANSVIEALMSLSELRDPYTAGHQRGVSNLACAMAREMGLPEERLENIRIAALLHDIGKISIPAEILSKPGLLNDNERNMVKTHPQASHDILNKAGMPEPIPRIVLQHHERMDGSGYPQSLRGEEILLEARIIVVADVIDAMASHRPYRPALSVDQALDEIAQRTGALYDAAVVAACFRVMNNEDFYMESSHREAYREAIYAATGGRLQLVHASEMESLAGSGVTIIAGQVAQAGDIPSARRKLRPCLSFPDKTRKNAVLLCLAEALTNAVKYAQSGRWCLRQIDEGLRLIVEDAGPGIRLKDLPRATLMQHHATTQSPRGSGFQTMLHYCDRMYLTTGRQGTRLALDFCLADRPLP